MGLDISMHIMENDHNAINRPLKLSPGPNTAASCAGRDTVIDPSSQPEQRALNSIQYNKSIQQYNTKSRH